MDCFEYLGYDVPVNLANMTGGGPETFPSISMHHQAMLRKWIDIAPEDNVLEVGCGIGRDAIPLSNYLTSGKYIGVDVIEPSINWLRQNVGSRNPRFSFHHSDIQDDLHNPLGKLRATDIRLPADDKSVNKIFLFSVFTHMFRDEIEHYLREFSRVLSPDGIVLSTMFIYNDDILSRARETNLTPWSLKFEYEMEEGVRFNSLDSKRGAVAFRDDTIRSIISGSPLSAVRFLNGSWSGYHDNVHDGQDAVILTVK